MDDENKTDNSKDANTSNSVRLKYFRTVCLSSAFCCLGICVAVIGPTLPTLAYNLQIQISTISFIMPARAVGYLIGSIVGGLIYEKMDGNLMIFLSLAVTAVGTMIIPYLTNVILVAIATSTIGISMGFLDTAGNVMCLQIWGEKSGPYLQTLHFLFAIGTTIAPLLALPFIMDAKQNEVNSTESVIVSFTDSGYNETSTTTFERFDTVSYVFICAAVFSFLVSLCFLYLSCFQKTHVSNQKNTIKEEGTIFRIQMLALLFLFFLVYVGMEVAFGVYIYTFAITCVNHYSKSQASLLNSLFWGAFAAGRFFAIFGSRKLSPSILLHADLIGTLVAAIALACFPYYAKSAEFIFWIAVAVYGLSIASIFPTGLSWAEQYITITGKAAMVLVVGSATGEMILPFIVGQYLEANPMFLMYFGVVAIFASIIIYAFLKYLARTKGKRLKVFAEDVNVKEEEELKDLAENCSE